MVPIVDVCEGVTLGDAVILGVGVWLLDGVMVGVVVTVGVGVGMILQYSHDAYSCIISPTLAFEEKLMSSLV